MVRETLDGFQGGLQIGRRIVKNLRHANDIILLANSEAELQELVDRLDQLAAWHSGRMEIITESAVNKPTHQHWQDQGNGERWHSVTHTYLEWATGAGGYVAVPWVPDYRRCECMTEFRTSLNSGQAKGAFVRSFVRYCGQGSSLLWTPALRPLCQSNAPAQGEEGNW